LIVAITMSPSSGSFLISAVTIRKGKPYKWHTLRLPCRNAVLLVKN
jgi:hypothetical protein